MQQELELEIRRRIRWKCFSRLIDVTRLPHMTCTNYDLSHATCTTLRFLLFEFTAFPHMNVRSRTLQSSMIPIFQMTYDSLWYAFKPLGFERAGMMDMAWYDMRKSFAGVLSWNFRHSVCWDDVMWHGMKAIWMWCRVWGSEPNYYVGSQYQGHETRQHGHHWWFCALCILPHQDHFNRPCSSWKTWTTMKMQ
jgi:hypothetical protein